MLEFLGQGDVLMVTRIDRLARSVGDLQDIVRTVRAKGAALRATEQPIDTGTAAGKCFLDMLGVFAEFETNLRRERQLEGIAKAKAEGVYKGRPPSIDLARVRSTSKAQAKSPTQIARALRIAPGRASIGCCRRPDRQDARPCPANGGRLCGLGHIEAPGGPLPCAAHQRPSYASPVNRSSTKGMHHRLPNFAPRCPWPIRSSPQPRHAASTAPRSCAPSGQQDHRRGSATRPVHGPSSPPSCTGCFRLCRWHFHVAEPSAAHAPDAEVALLRTLVEEMRATVADLRHREDDPQGRPRSLEGDRQCNAQRLLPAPKPEDAPPKPGRSYSDGGDVVQPDAFARIA